MTEFLSLSDLTNYSKSFDVSNRLGTEGENREEEPEMKDG